MRAGVLAAALAALASAGAGADQPASEAPPQKPAAAEQQKAVADAGAGDEYKLAVNEGVWRVLVTLRPGKPKPGQPLDVVLDVARHPDIPDPTYGERVPLQKALLAVAFSGPGAKARYKLWPLADAGLYATHWTPGARGLWTVELGMQDPTAQGPHLSFQVGVGVPMPASSEGHMVRKARVVVGADKPASSSSQRDPMAELGTLWLKLLHHEGKEADRVAWLKAAAQLARSPVGHVPPQWAKDWAEHDNLASDLAGSLEVFAASPPEERQAKLHALDTDSCLRCHVKFRDSVVGDLIGWPEVKPWKR